MNKGVTELGASAGKPQIFKAVQETMNFPYSVFRIYLQQGIGIRYSMNQGLNDLLFPDPAYFNKFGKINLNKASKRKVFMVNPFIRFPAMLVESL